MEQASSQSSDATMLVFVYGSLKRGYRLHDFMSTSRFLGPAVTLPHYRLFDCGEYPGLVEVSMEGVAVSGEIYEMVPEMVDVLDDVEGVDEGLYRRGVVSLQPPYTDLEVMAYFYERPVGGLQDCGTQWPS